MKRIYRSTFRARWLLLNQVSNRGNCGVKRMLYNFEMNARLCAHEYFPTAFVSSQNQGFESNNKKVHIIEGLDRVGPILA